MWWQVRIWRRLLQVQNSLRCVVLCLLSSCLHVVVCCLVSMCVIHIKSKLKRFCLSSIFLVFIIVKVDANSVFDVCVDAASPRRTRTSRRERQRAHGSNFVGETPRFSLYYRTLKKIPARIYRQLDQPRCRRASRVHYVKRVSGRSSGLAHRFTNRIWWGLWRGLQDFSAELTRNAAEFSNLSGARLTNVLVLSQS